MTRKGLSKRVIVLGSALLLILVLVLFLLGVYVFDWDFGLSFDSVPLRNPNYILTQDMGGSMNVSTGEESELPSTDAPRLDYSTPDVPGAMDPDDVFSGEDPSVQDGVKPIVIIDPDLDGELPSTPVIDEILEVVQTEDFADVYASYRGEIDAYLNQLRKLWVLEFQAEWMVEHSTLESGTFGLMDFAKLYSDPLELTAAPLIVVPFTAGTISDLLDWVPLFESLSDRALFVFLNTSFEGSDNASILRQKFSELGFDLSSNVWYDYYSTVLGAMTEKGYSTFAVVSQDTGLYAGGSEVPSEDVLLELLDGAVIQGVAYEEQLNQFLIDFDDLAEFLYFERLLYCLERDGLIFDMSGIPEYYRSVMQKVLDGVTYEEFLGRPILAGPFKTKVVDDGSQIDVGTAGSVSN